MRKSKRRKKRLPVQQNSSPLFGDGRQGKFFSKGDERDHLASGSQPFFIPASHSHDQAGTQNMMGNGNAPPAVQMAEGSAGKAAPSVLDLKELKKGKVQGCGELSNWIVQWKLNRPSLKGGYVIQNAVRYSYIEDCSGKDITKKKTSKRLWDFWEAWKVNPGQKVTDYAQNGDPRDDWFSHPDRGNNTKGEVNMFGVAKFYEGLTSLPSHFKTNNPDTLAHSLPSTTTDPKLKGGTYAAGHGVNYEWDCCASPSTRKTKSRFVF
ncbi:MAG: hypothetical protein AAF502_06995 [Bacteroidota bacterium]